MIQQLCVKYNDTYRHTAVYHIFFRSIFWQTNESGGDSQDKTERVHVEDSSFHGKN